MKPIFIQQYDYDLSDERIAKYPLRKRDESKLLIYRKGEITEKKFLQISEELAEGSLLIYNNTKVIQARMIFYKNTGARIEIFCLEPVSPSDYALSFANQSECTWKCMVGNLKKWKNGILVKELSIGNEKLLFTATLIKGEGNVFEIKFGWNNPAICFADILDQAGELPIPPYLNRKTEESDKQNYQTVYSKIEGSVAAPTAGLHFTPEVLAELGEKKIEITELTLHVGAGTFQPVKADDISDHQMHTEIISVKKETIQKILAHKGPIIAVGTTTVRTLESLYYLGKKILLEKTVSRSQIPDEVKIDNTHPETLKNDAGLEVKQWDSHRTGPVVEQWEPYQNEYGNKNIEPDSSTVLEAIIEDLNLKGQSTLHAQTRIMIRPGYHFHIIDGLITNFHQPRSTLLLLVSALIGDDWKKVYEYALENDFRFLSYGDSSLLLP